MKRRIFLCNLLLSLTLTGQAQTPMPVFVSSAEDASRLPLVEIWVSSHLDFSPNHIIDFAVTDASGKAGLKTQSGTQFIRLSRLGYRDHIDSFNTNRSRELHFKLRLAVMDLDGAVVTVQYQKQTADKAVERILVLDAKELQSRSVVNLREALSQQMNIQIRNDNSTGSAMSMMGISGQNVKILIDGVPVIGRLDGNIDLAQINLNDIQRIEVVEGPLSTNYGSNALAGVINIITKRTAQTVGRFSADIYSESVGQDNFAFGAAKKIGKYDIRLSTGRNFFSGWTPGDSGRWDLWKPKEQYFGRLQVHRKVGNVVWGARSEAFREFLLNKGKPLSPYYETAFDERFYTRRLDQKVTAAWEISKEASFQAFAAVNLYNRKRLKYFRNLVTLVEQGINHSGGSDTTGLVAFMSRATYSRIPKDHKMSYQLGYDIIVERGSGIRLKDGSQSLSDLAIFTTAEYRITPQLSFKPGFRLAYNSAFQTPIVPMLSTRLKRGNYTYRASYSQGFRAPDIKELFIEFIDINHYVIGNTKLEPEKSNHALLSIDGKRLLNKMTLKPSFTMFYNDIRDKITLANFAPGQYSYVNISEFKSTGGNMNIAIDLSGFSFRMGYALTGIRTDLSAADPGFTFYDEWNASIRKKWRGFDVNLFAKFNGQQNIYTIDAENAAVTQRFTGAYTLVDAQIGKAYFDGQLRFQVGIKNILNVQNVENVFQSSGAHGSDAGYLAVGNGTNYFLKLSLRSK